MTIFCKVCERRLQSLKPDQTAQSDVMTTMGNHLAERHPAEATELAMMLQACATYLLLKKYVMVPETETALRQTFQVNEHVLLEFFELGPPAPAASV